tara:strand:+ start:116 stop:649 length:534 start_codon:yes stop_codon:yes gene_type:complete
MESPVTKQLSRDLKAGHRWEGMFIIGKMLASTAREWKAWFSSMQGPVKTFYAYDPDNRTPIGIADVGSDTPQIKGANQTGNSCTTDGWRNNGTGLLLPGDHVQLDTELKEVTEQVDSDGSGNATINFEPAFHVSPGDNNAVTFENPKGIFRLVGNDVPFDSDEFGRHDFAFAFVEDF